MSELRGILKPEFRTKYIFGGNATITIQNPSTGNRFTFKIQQTDFDDSVFFAKLLNGPDNENSYAYMGKIKNQIFSLTKASRMTMDAPSIKALRWFMANINDPRIEVWHEGSCGKCGRKLTVPESIESGLGPICAGKEQ